MGTSSKSRRTVQFFRIEFHIGSDVYGVVPLQPDAGVARKAYRLFKHTGKERATYDVRLTPEGHAECECKGHLRWGHCRHVRALKAAGMI